MVETRENRAEKLSKLHAKKTRIRGIRKRI